MEDKVITLPKVGEEEFWKFYDRFCDPIYLKRLIETGESDLISQMRQAMEASHRARTIYYLSRPERKWESKKAWLTLRNAPVRNDQGDPVLDMRIGDVIVIEPGWDRDVIITHNPIPRNIVSGYLLSGKWEEMVGLFMPLFNQATIMHCIQVRTLMNVQDALKLAEQEAKDWHWP